MKNYYKTIIYFIGLALSNLSANFLPRKPVVIERAPGNVSFSILETCYRTRSELPHSALPVDMSMTQHLSLWDFLAVAVVGTNVRTSLIPPPAGKKNQSPYPPARPTTTGSQAGGCLVITTRALSELSPRPQCPASAHQISRPSRARRSAYWPTLQSGAPRGLR